MKQNIIDKILHNQDKYTKKIVLKYIKILFIDYVKLKSFLMPLLYKILFNSDVFCDNFYIQVLQLYFTESNIRIYQFS